MKQLRHRYGGGAEISFPDWVLDAGGHALLVGPSGSGKTTLLSIVGGMLQPTSGQAIVAGQDLRQLSAGALDRFRGQTIGLVPQKLHLIASLTVAENLQLAQYLAHLPKNPQRIHEVLTRLGVAELAQRRPHQLSGGQSQRVAIARAVVNKPKLLLADEPTANLDDDAATAVIDLLEREAGEVGASLLIASHDGRVKSRIGHSFALQRQQAEETA
ncbi:ABC transporter ATP-binding protein [Parachitinimonas caeni]|uniref:ABC transporter ATP-binding protein n=1 Tax=Parachitinimonas caeni TaxID=3031301 RepID=A0ABT7E2S1_9NEIS|nr:ABC transporter ATP-binding protein [Parachitinimonas caeni]MDK2126605.1 ABC transporter ATP-binding protein [Parachitinimonas caeni]